MAGDRRLSLTSSTPATWPGGRFVKNNGQPTTGHRPPLLIESARRGILKLVANPSRIDAAMPRCPYCARPLKGLGLKCRACRRYILRWPHLLVLATGLLVAVLVLLELLLRTH